MNTNNKKKKLTSMGSDNLKILLIYPKCPDTFWSFKYALKFIGKKSSLPPLGLITVAAMLPEKWEKKMIDLNIETLKEKTLNWADMVFISAMSIQSASCREVINRCKKKGIKVVAGGPLFTTDYSNFEDVDHLVLNEAECSLSPFINDLLKNEPKPLYSCDSFPEITETHCPQWELVKKNKYDSMCVQYSRGCPYDCEFCDIVVLNGHKPRIKTSEQIINELDQIYNIGWRGGVFFVDDNFIGNSKLLKRDLLPRIIKWMREKDYPFNFFTEASINLADDEGLMQLMSQAGFDKVFIGIETPNQESLTECNKYINNTRDMIKSIKTIQSHGMEVQGGFIIGFDNDPAHIFKMQIDFIQESGIITAMVGLLNALQGTRLYKRLKNEGRLLSIANGNNTDFSLNFVPKMNKDKLIRGYKEVLKGIYSPKEYYKRVLIFFKNFDQKKHGEKSKLYVRDILAFIRSIWRLGIIGKERFYYWRLILWTLKNRPELFGKAIKFSIFGFHFRKTFKT